MNEEEENNPIASEAPPIARQKTLDADLTDTAESSPSDQYDNGVDRVLFVGASPEPPKRPSGSFANEDELLFES
jgi:hypothetical protein